MMNRERFGRCYRRVQHAGYAADLRRYNSDLDSRREAEKYGIFLRLVRPNLNSDEYPDMDDAPPFAQRFPRSWKNSKRKRQYRPLP